jgi:hypothetical protein
MTNPTRRYVHLEDIIKIIFEDLTLSGSRPCGMAIVIHAMK